MESTVKMMISTAVLGGLVAVAIKIYNVLVSEPKKRRYILQKQGIKGPSPSSFFLGNLFDIKTIQDRALKSQYTGTGIYHNWPLTSFAYLHHFTRQFGPIFTYSVGIMQIVCTTDIDLVKEISNCTSVSLGKPSYLSKERGPLLGHGILASNGPLWAHQRKVIAPELNLERNYKRYKKLIVDSTNSVTKSWESRIENEGGVAEIRVDKEMQSLAALVISNAFFGSDFSEGKEIFSKLGCLTEAMSKIIIGIPILRYLPTANNRKIRRLEKDIERMILKVVKERSESTTTHQKDLLQKMLEGATNCSNSNGISFDISSRRFIVDNCKNIYFAGTATSALTLSWCFVLLAAYPDWQDCIRLEILNVCKDGFPDADMLLSLKTVTMVIQETLRLYPPTGFVFREALDAIKFKNIVIPKGMGIQIPIPMVHQNPDVWGPDAHQFNPKRFENGVLGACKNPQAYMPFGIGPRVCAGRDFVMTEMKVILTLILSKFSLSLSPKYQHSPVIEVNLVPQYGITLYVKRA